MFSFRREYIYKGTCVIRIVNHLHTHTHRHRAWHNLLPPIVYANFSPPSLSSQPPPAPFPWHPRPAAWKIFSIRYISRRRSLRSDRWLTLVYCSWHYVLVRRRLAVPVSPLMHTSHDVRHIPSSARLNANTRTWSIRRNRTSRVHHPACATCWAIRTHIPIRDCRECLR